MNTFEGNKQITINKDHIIVLIENSTKQYKINIKELIQTKIFSKNINNDNLIEKIIKKVIGNNDYIILIKNELVIIEINHIILDEEINILIHLRLDKFENNYDKVLESNYDKISHNFDNNAIIELLIRILKEKKTIKKSKYPKTITLYAKYIYKHEKYIKYESMPNINDIFNIDINNLNNEYKFITNNTKGLLSDACIRDRCGAMEAEGQTHNKTHIDNA